MLLRYITIGLLYISVPGLVMAQLPSLPKGNDFTLNYTVPQKVQLAGITVKGNQYLDGNALIAISGLKVGDKVTVPGPAMTNAMKKLWAQGLLANVNIEIEKTEGNKLWLVIQVKERPRLTAYNITGLSRSQTTTLQNQISLVRGRILTDVILKNTEKQVLGFLHQKGFLHARVNMQQVPDNNAGNGVRLTIQVQRGKKVRVHNITFTGNRNASQARLRKAMRNTGEKPRLTLPIAIISKTAATLSNGLAATADSLQARNLSKLRQLVNDNVKLNILKGVRFKQEGYDDDKQSIIAWYRSKGYRDARIESDSLRPRADGNIDINIKVFEGNRYHLRNISWQGNFIYSDSLLSKVLGLKKGDVYDRAVIEQRLNYNPVGRDVSSLYMDNGYLRFSVQPVVVRMENDSVDLEMRIFEGRRYRIGRVIVQGNTITSDKVVLRNLRVIPGNIFRRSDLVRSTQELAALRFFDPEQLDFRPELHPETQTVDIIFTVVESPQSNLELSGSWGGSDVGFIGSFGFTFNNFSLHKFTSFKDWHGIPRGDGQTFGLRLQSSGRAYQNASLTFAEPWLGGKKPNNLSINLSHSISRTTDTEGNENGKFSTSSVALGFSRRIQFPDDYFTLSHTLRYTHFDINDVALFPGFSNGISRSLTFTTTLARTQLDNPLFPRNGSQISLALTLTPPYSLVNDNAATSTELADVYRNVEYHQWEFDAAIYRELAPNLVFHAGAHFGFLGTYSRGAPLGPFERYQMGGNGLGNSNSVLLGVQSIGLRGYDDNALNPIDEQGIEGGTSFAKYVFELRYQIAPNPLIYGLVFAEGGNVWNDYADFDPFNVFKSVGFGVRINLPMGLIGVDFGWGLDDSIGTLTPSPSRITFRLGNSFR